MTRSPTTMTFFSLSLLLLLFGSVKSLECRTGFNTSFFSLPIEMWQETRCADNSVCFLSEISHDRTQTLGQRVSISFGACLSRVYESQLECENLFAPGGLFPNQFISLIPDLQPQIDQLLTKFANETANNVLQYLSGGLNIQAGITKQILDRVNITISNEFQVIVQRFDHVLVALFNNNNTAIVASLDNLLNSFNSLTISNPPIVMYLEAYYQLYNITIPDKYKPLISGSLSYIYQLLNQSGQSVLTQLLSSLSKPFQLYTASVPPQVQKLMEILNGFISVAVSRNQQTMVQYALQALRNFSSATTESQELGQAIISYIEQFNITLNIDIKEVLLRLPGILNAALPNNTTLLGSIFSNIAEQLTTAQDIIKSSAETAKETDLSKLMESILTMTGRNLTELDRIYIRSSIYSFHKSLEKTAQMDKLLLAIFKQFNTTNDLGLAIKNLLLHLNITLPSQLNIFLDNLQPLVNILQGNSSAVSGINCHSNSVTRAFATELINELGRRGLRIPEKYRHLFECFPAIFYNFLPNNAALIDSIFANVTTSRLQNVSASLRDFFVKLRITLPEEFYRYINNQQTVFDALFKGNLTEVFLLLQEISKDRSQVTDLSQLVETFLSNAGIKQTAETQRIAALINGFIQIAASGDKNNIAQYAFQALQNFSVPTNASLELGKAIASYIEQFNVSLSPVIEEVIIRIPGLFNLVFPNKTDTVNMIFRSISIELNKINISDPFGSSLNLALRQLKMANITFPQEKAILITSLNDLYFALIEKDQLKILEWLTNVLAKIYSETTDTVTRLSEALKDAIEQITKKPIHGNIGILIDYTLRIPIKHFPGNTSLIDMIYQNITYHLKTANFTQFDPSSIDRIFQSVDLSIIPDQLRPYINITRDLMKAVIANDTNKLMQLGFEAISRNCVTNEVTNGFVDALMNDLKSRGLNIPVDIATALRCIPGTFYSLFPNNTDVINSILQQATATFSMNATELLSLILSKAKVTLPELLFNDIVSQLEAINSLARLNLTEGIFLLIDSYKQFIKETELSKLIEMIVSKTGKTLSDTDLLNIRNSALSVYRSFPNESATLDLFFSTIRNDLSIGKEWGFALKNAFSLINITIPTDWNFLLDNLHPLLEISLGNRTAVSNINCSTTPITGAFSSALYNELVKRNVNITEQYRHLFECLPAVLYASLPNDTVLLESILTDVTTSLSQNVSASLRSLFVKLRIALPEEFYRYINSQQTVFDALFKGNLTEVFGLLQEIIKDRSQVMNLSKLVETFLSNAGIKQTAETQRIAALINGFIQIAALGDKNNIAQYAFQALQNFSVPTNASLELGKAIASYIEQFNISLSPVIEEVIIRIPGLFNLVFPNKTDTVNMIFRSISIELNKINISDPFGSSLNLALRQLKMANITLPQETAILITSLNDLYFALIEKDQLKILEWLTNVLAKIYSETTDAVTRLNEALKDAIEQITKKPIDGNIGILIDYTLRIPIKHFPGNTSLIDMIYQNITYHLKTANFTQFDPSSIDRIFQSVDLSIIPDQLRPYINITRDLMKAVIANDTNKLMQLGFEAISRNCVTNEVTNGFVDALMNDLKSRGLNIPVDIATALRCIPGTFYSLFPNNTDVINSILQQATATFSMNATELLSLILSKAKVTLPELLFNDIVSQLEAINSLARLNLTEGIFLLIDSYKQFIKETELSKLIEMIVSKTGKTLSDTDLLNIRNSALSVYRSFPNKSATLDLFFSTIRNDLSIGKEWGFALKNAFSLINITIPTDWNFLLDNLHPLLEISLGNRTAVSTINCSTTPITGAFSSALYNELVKRDVNIPKQYRHLFECLPAVFYAFFPNDTVQLESIFAIVTSMISQNKSQSLQSILRMYNVHIPQVNDAVFGQLDLLDALTRGNLTEIYKVWLDSYKKTAKETELSKIIELILTMAARNLTELDKLHIKNSAFSLYQSLPDNTAQLDMLFSSILSDFNSTNDWGLVITNALSNLNVTLPSQVNILLDNLQPFVYILQGNSSAGIVCPSNSVSKAFATEVTSELGKRGVYIPEQYRLAFECFPAVFHNVFPNNTALIDSIFTDVTTSLSRNVSASLRSLFVKFAITMPEEFYIYIDSQQILFDALIQGNLTEVFALLQRNFRNQSQVTDLIKHVEIFLSNVGIRQTAETQRIVALINGFIQVATSGDKNNINQTEVIKSIFQAYNVTIPSEFNRYINVLAQAITEIISSSNATDIARRIKLLASKTAPQTELSKFIVTVLTKFGASVSSEDLITVVKQLAATAYTDLTEQVLDTFFSNLNADIASRVDVGFAIRNALLTVNQTLPREVEILFSNLQPLLNAIFAENTTAITLAIQGLLEAYATAYPEQTYYRLSTEMLKLGFVLQAANATLTKEVTNIIVNIYNTILKTANITQKDLNELLVSRFLPELQPFLFLINAIEPNDVVLLAVDFTTWLINPRRTVQTLFVALNRTIHTVYNRLDIDLRQEIKSILNPDMCRYGVCATNLCNVQDILRNITAVTPPPETTASTKPATTSQAAASQTPTNSSAPITTNPTSTSPAATTTSRMGMNAKKNASWFTIVFTSFFAFMAALS